MKRLTTILLLAMAACLYQCTPQSDSNPAVANTSQEKAARLAEASPEELKYDFQKISVVTSFNLPGENLEVPVEEFQERVMSRRKFIAQSKLPLLDPFRPVNDRNNDWKKADKEYRQFLIARQGHSYLPVFRRMGSVLILKDLALLADESEEGKQAIAFYTNELFESGGHTSAALVYYCLQALKGTWSDAKIKQYAQRAVEANAQSPELAQMRDAPARVEREKATATAEDIRQVEPMVAKMAEMVAEQEEYVAKLRTI